jgi:predicted nuclease of predicted toxin-antitoxin system
VKFLFDNDLPHPIASALRILQKPVQHVRDISDLGAGSPDDLILDYAGSRGFVLVTRDKAIRRTPQYRTIIAKHRVGVVLISAGKAKQLDAWNLAKLVIRAWDNIESHTAARRAPFFALVQLNGRVVSLESAGRKRRASHP